MSQETGTTTGKQAIFLRGLFMLVTVMLFQLAGTLLCIVAIIQFVMVLLNDTPNPRLLSFGRSLGQYLRQAANYLAFASEDIPFPFNDWPSDT